MFRTVAIQLIFSFFLSYVAYAAPDNMKLGNSGVVLDNFNTNGYSLLKGNGKEPEEVKWAIYGKKAVVNHTIYDITDFRMTVDMSCHGRHKMISEFCQLDQTTKEMHSSRSISITGDGVQLGGNGYDIYWDEEERGIIIIIRSAAHITIEEEVIENQRQSKN